MSEFTLIIPTRNRPALLDRQLRYYADQFAVARMDGGGHNSSFPIIIADSSDAKAESFVDHLRYRHVSTWRMYDQQVSVFDKLHDILSSVTTPLVVIGADDDFFAPAALRKAADWLAAYQGYSLCSGRALTFDADMHLAPYPQHSVEQETPDQRLAAHLSNYSTTWYSMQRTDVARRNYALTLAAGFDPHNLSELLPSCLSVIAGKSHVLDDLYMARQVWPGRQEARTALQDVPERDWSRFIALLGDYGVRNHVAEQATRAYRSKRGRAWRRYLQIARTLLYQPPSGFEAIEEFV